MKNLDVFTTSEVAQICRVSTRIVTKWYDNKILTGYTLPGSKHRRFTYADVKNFMTTQQLPINWLDEAIKTDDSIEVAKAGVEE